MEGQLLKKLKLILGQDFVTWATESYLYDEVELSYRPDGAKNCLLTKPCSTEQIAAIMNLSYEKEIPVVVRGGATGLCAGCTPIKPSIIISMERMKNIVDIDEKNMVAVMEGGVTLMELLEKLKSYKGMGFPVHPGDEGAQMGGMAATNAAGARAVRHGPMRRHLMGLTVVTPRGEVLKLGGKLIKNNAGYNLMQLIIGSEGTLAVITEVILRLYPEEENSATLVAPFPTVEDACNSVMELIRSGVMPLAVEYMDKRLFVDTAHMLGLDWQAKEGVADLLIVLEEKSSELLMESVRKVNDICRRNNSYSLLYAGKKREQDELLLVRSEHYNLIKDEICDSFDMAVPLSAIPEFIRALKALAEEYDTDTNVIAHIADGNVHNDILLVDGKVPCYAKELKEKMYAACFAHGGTITGEHGIGKIRIEDLIMQKDPVEIQLMADIKKVFDPKYLLNPMTVIKQQ